MVVTGSGQVALLDVLWRLVLADGRECGVLDEGDHVGRLDEAGGRRREVGVLAIILMPLREGSGLGARAESSEGRHEQWWNVLVPKMPDTRLHRAVPCGQGADVGVVGDGGDGAGTEPEGGMVPA